MTFEHASDVESFLEVENHDEAPIEEVDIQAPDTGIREARRHFRPDLGMILPVGRDDARGVAQFEGEHVAIHGCPDVESRDHTGPRFIYLRTAGSSLGARRWMTASAVR